MMPKHKYRVSVIFLPHQAMVSVTSDVLLSDEQITTRWGTYYLLLIVA